MNPRDSMPTTTSIFFAPIFASSPSIAAANESPSLRSVVMSLKRIPGFGKSGMSRILLARRSVCTGTTQRVAEGRVQSGPDAGWTCLSTGAIGRPRAFARGARRMQCSDAPLRRHRVVAKGISGGLPDTAQLEAPVGDGAASIRAGADAGDDGAVVIDADSRRAGELLRKVPRGLAPLRRADHGTERGACVPRHDLPAVA